MQPVYLQAMGVLSALGADAAALREGLFAEQYLNSVQLTERYSPQRPLPLGLVPLLLPGLDFAAPKQRSRNNALAWAAVQQIREPVQAAIERFGSHRVALIIGTSTAGVEEGEQAAKRLLEQGRFPDGFDYALQEMGNVAGFLAQQLGITGPAHAISTACSSGAKALASAGRLLRSGMVDAVVAGGVDALCSFTVAGFSALESVSVQRCNPLSRNRQGINLGEAAALFLVGCDAGPVRMAGWGESQDAHHMSAPDPTGKGAILAMEQALARASVRAAAVDYVNLHGTATLHNDAMESLAVHTLLGPDVPVSSTKPLTGHSLAAAGALEAAVAWQVLVNNPQGRLPVHWWDGVADSALPALRLVAPGMSLGRQVKNVLSNSFAFGGSNAALLLAAE